MSLQCTVLLELLLGTCATIVLVSAGETPEYALCRAGVVNRGDTAGSQDYLPPEYDPLLHITICI